jgi:alkanesulfonate monooxygenase SsuD/methylene tetrahydromethanopterin reductase-like flavin-dependent oxidoreductase (luciferase family)
VYAWSGNGERAEIAHQVGQVRAAWRDAGRATPPRLVAGFWCSLARDAEPRLRQHVQGYVGLHDAKLGRALAARLTRFTPEAIARALDDYQELGIDECMLLPVTRELAEVDRLAQLVAKRG